MHFLLTNDDGIDAVGIRALAEAALKRGHKVTICAPSEQQSAASARLTLTRPLTTHKKEWPGVDAFAIDGTPVDCVRVAPYLGETPYDFCLSGVNNGENAGTAAYYSGTVNAAREATMGHMKSMAVSVDAHACPEALQRTAEMAVEIAEKYADIELPRMCVINFNAPATHPDTWKELKIAPISEAYFLDTYEKRVSPYGVTYFWMNAGLQIEPREEGSDLYLLEQNHPVVTFLGGIKDFNDTLGGKLKG